MRFIFVLSGYALCTTCDVISVNVTRYQSWYEFLDIDGILTWQIKKNKVISFNDFDLHENETHCMNGFALRLVLKKRHKKIRKWRNEYCRFWYRMFGKSLSFEKKKLSQQNLGPFSFMAGGKKADLTVKNGIFCEHLVVKGLMREMVSPSLT